jgi:hypothetical protein
MITTFATIHGATPPIDLGFGVGRAVGPLGRGYLALHFLMHAHEKIAL